MSLIKKSKIMWMATFILGMAAKPSFSAIFNVASDFSQPITPMALGATAGHQALGLASTCIAT